MINFKDLQYKIKDLIGMDYVLEMYGIESRNNRCICPFHDSKGYNPSLAIKDNKSFTCFNGACGVHGDVITFVSLMDNITIGESKILLADRLGITDGKLSPVQQVRRANNVKIQSKKQMQTEFRHNLLTLILNKRNELEKYLKTANGYISVYSREDWLDLFGKKHARVSCEVGYLETYWDAVFYAKTEVLREIYKNYTNMVNVPDSIVLSRLYDNVDLTAKPTEHIKYTEELKVALSGKKEANNE